MKRLKFIYEKTNGQQSNYDLIVTNSTTEKFYGIDLNKLNEEEKKEVIEIQKEYELKIEPYIKKAFRQFNKTMIVEHTDQEII